METDLRHQMILIRLETDGLLRHKDGTVFVRVDAAEMAERYPNNAKLFYEVLCTVMKGLQKQGYEVVQSGPAKNRERKAAMKKSMKLALSDSDFLADSRVDTSGLIFDDEILSELVGDIVGFPRLDSFEKAIAVPPRTYMLRKVYA